MRVTAAMARSPRAPFPILAALGGDAQIGAAAVKPVLIMP